MITTKLHMVGRMVEHMIFLRNMMSMNIMANLHISIQEMTIK
jgi:hypothetical protein